MWWSPLSFLANFWPEFDFTGYSNSCASLLLDILIFPFGFQPMGSFASRIHFLKMINAVSCFTIQSVSLYLYSGELWPSAVKIIIERGLLILGILLLAFLVI